MALIDNKKVRFDYEILDTFDAGLELFGCEVKSIRAGRGSLKGSHVIIRGAEAFLIGADISAFQPKNAPENFDPKRHRRLLLKAKEIATLSGTERQKGLTIVPLSVYNKKRLLKISIAVVRGKKQHDKREVLKKRTAEREMNRTLKNK